tara:strand:+ start:1777 stop:2364 length:588 start_codon:yes stop_codon:yes gene_type:complete
MKANDILNKIKNIVGVELSEEKTELAEMTLENGTVLVAEAFEKGESIFIKTEEEQIALPVGEYKMEDGKILVVTEEGLIDSIKEAVTEEEEEEKELSEENITEEVETEMEEEKEEMYVTKEEFSVAMNELKKMIEEMKEVKEKEDLSKEAEQIEMSAEPIKHNPEEKKQKVNFKIGGSRTNTTMDTVYSKIFNNN